jgi:sulfite oxidase
MERFGKDSALIIRREDPFNAGPPPELARSSYITPTDLFFVRNHGRVPTIDPDRYRLSVTGLVHKSLSLSLAEICEEFPKTTVVAALQCAGNRRQELMRVAEISGEVPWDTEAVSNGVWGGVSLRLILRIAGIRHEAGHVAFGGLDEVSAGGNVGDFGGSVPTEKAVSPEVILAYEMNGQPLPAAHGYPLRVVVPGYIGARSVKWLGSITAQPFPSDNYFQTRAYKLYSPWVSAQEAHLHAGWTLAEQKTSSCICSPRSGERLAGRSMVVQGYATAGGGREIERVELTDDEGRTWTTASLVNYRRPWGWCFWEARLNLRYGTNQIAVRAWDSAGETQPRDAGDVWNFKGYMNNSWHRIVVQAQATDRPRVPIARVDSDAARL